MLGNLKLYNTKLKHHKKGAKKILLAVVFEPTSKLVEQRLEAKKDLASIASESSKFVIQDIFFCKVL